MVLVAALGCFSDLRDNVCNQELVRKSYMGSDGMQVYVLD